MHPDDALDRGLDTDVGHTGAGQTGMGRTQMGHPIRPRFSWREEVIVRTVARALGGGEIVGRLRLTLPSGRVETFGRVGGTGGPDAQVVLHTFAPLWRGLRRGALGLVEAHMAGAMDTPDVGAVLRFWRANARAYAAIGHGLMRLDWLDRRWHRRRANTPAGSRRNIAAHYDLGNAFYALWLDPTMTYSSAIYRDEGASLEAAQQDKIARVVAALDLRPGQTVLEIGCGWGALAEAIARAGADVTAITLSAEQLAFTEARIASAGLADRARARFCDYRDVEGRYDRIVSIEMIEAVGEENWPTYFGVLRDRLRPGGTALVQAITIDAPHFAAYRRQPDFIQRYIFPGGMLPTVDAMAREAAGVGLAFDTLETFGAGYARTLAAWRTRFDAVWPEIAALGFDERFRRMWRYYLSYCEIGFETGDIDVGLYRMARPAGG
jgi:cyclopropane-fatty-acyl-phospholipid synthase